MKSAVQTRMIIVAAPSGAGKSSFVERICREEKRLEDTVTFTTRKMRAGESPGHPYHFVSLAEFDALKNKNYFVEWAQVHDNFYGTPLEQLEMAWSIGKCIIMDVDIQGADTFKAKFPDSKSIFILPPSIEELRRRVVKRDGKVPDDLEVRMRNAEKELKHAPLFDFQIINDDFEGSYLRFKKIVEELLG
ncbi:MAG: guanylate kinase [Pseudobdellovibrionaceae bacterium]